MTSKIQLFRINSFVVWSNYLVIIIHKEFSARRGFRHLVPIRLFIIFKPNSCCGAMPAITLLLHDVSTDGTILCRNKRASRHLHTTSLSTVLTCAFLAAYQPHSNPKNNRYMYPSNVITRSPIIH